MEVPYFYKDFAKSHDPAITTILKYIHDEKIESPSGIDTHVIAGRYAFGDHKVATIIDSEQGLHLEITDYLPYGFADVKTDLYFTTNNSYTTHMRDVELIVTYNDAGEKNLSFNWRGVNKPLKKVDDKYNPVLKHIFDKNYKLMMKQLAQGQVIPPNLNLDSILRQIYEHVKTSDPNLADEIQSYMNNNCSQGLR